MTRGSRFSFKSSFVVMRRLIVFVARCVLASAGLALIASTAAASPLFAAVEQSSLRSAGRDAFSPQHAILKPGRFTSDHAAALESVQIALSRVADGSMYVWHRPSGLMSGSVKPTATFRAHNGELCRHLVMEISSEENFRTLEGIACRAANGVWRLDG